jgi:hypothetical protein
LAAIRIATSITIQNTSLATTLEGSRRVPREGVVEARLLQQGVGALLEERGREPAHEKDRDRRQEIGKKMHDARKHPLDFGAEVHGVTSSVGERRPG